MPPSNSATERRRDMRNATFERSSKTQSKLFFGHFFARVKIVASSKKLQNFRMHSKRSAESVERLRCLGILRR